MWCFKQIILNIIVPLCRTKKKRIVKQLPWFDNELLILERKCSKLFAKYKKRNTKANYEKFHQVRYDYHKLLRNKKIAYFLKNTPTNSKDFWSFYSNVIDIKSNHSI